MERLDHLVRLVVTENERQNLVAPSTIATIWNRHVLDSIQLLALAKDTDGLWLDIGTGGGFPGMVLAASSPRPFVFAEPRRRRADFLREAAEALELTNVNVCQCKVERVFEIRATVISARAVAPIEDVFAAAKHCSTWNTTWLLPRGASASSDLHDTQRMWHGQFGLEPSVTDPVSHIVVATGVAAR